MKKIFVSLFAAIIVLCGSISVFAEDAAASSDVAAVNPFTQYFSIIILVAMVVLFYFLVIRPQKKQEKETADMRNSIKVGDEIVTIGGIIGTVIIVRDDKLMIETGNDKTKLTLLRSSVKQILGAEEEK